MRSERPWHLRLHMRSRDTGQQTDSDPPLPHMTNTVPLHSQCDLCFELALISFGGFLGDLSNSMLLPLPTLRSTKTGFCCCCRVLSPPYLKWRQYEMNNVFPYLQHRSVSSKLILCSLVKPDSGFTVWWLTEASSAVWLCHCGFLTSRATAEAKA